MEQKAGAEGSELRDIEYYNKSIFARLRCQNTYCKRK
jgi:hypothetical protein